MDLYNVANRLSRLIPDGSYTNLNQLFIYVNTNKTLQQFTHNFPLETAIKLVFFIDSIKKNIERKYVEWSVNNNLYVFDVICFGESPGGVECDNCSGSGYEDCGSCGGSGDDSCWHCEGTGKQEVEDDEEQDEEELAPAAPGVMVRTPWYPGEGGKEDWRETLRNNKRNMEIYKRD